MKLFAASSSQKLAQSISTSLSIPLSNYELVRFDDSELKPVIKEDVRGETCIVVCSTSNPVNDSYMELFLMADALKRAAAEKIIAVTPYFGYARQNQMHMTGEPVSAHVMVNFIEASGINELITIDLHEDQVGGFFSIPLTHISALPTLAGHIAKTIGQTDKTIFVMSPDQGGVERTRAFRDALERHSREGGNLTIDPETGMVEKKRNLLGKHETKVVEVTGEVHDKIVIIPDDVIVSGGTISHAAEAVREKGAHAIYLCATHADFLERTVETLQNAPVEKVIVTDTIEIKPEWEFEKLSACSISDLLSASITSIVE